MSKIEWTGETWNPISGCSRKSSGCQNCYAEVMTKRLAAMGNEKYQGLLNEQNRFNGVIKFDEKALLKPLSIKKSTTFFVNSMSDLFHENVPDEWIDKIFAVMALASQHTFQILTKRPERMREYLTRQSNEFGRDVYTQINKGVVNPVGFVGFPRPNIWIGVSVENQKAADERIPLLLETPAAIRFLSCEPLLSAIEFSDVTNRSDAVSQIGKKALNGIDWVIVGGESGTGARPCKAVWIESIVKQCDEAKVACFVKQMGSNSIYPPRNKFDSEYRKKFKNRKGGDIEEFPLRLRVRQMPEVK